MAPVLEFENVSKRYRSLFGSQERWALRDFSLQIESGEIVGFLGPNGAGKTTAINITLGLVQPTGGRGSMLGQNFGNAPTRRKIGFLSESPTFYHQSARDVLKFCGALNGLREPELSKRINDLLERLGLVPDADRNVGKFSRGMLQRVGIAQALLNDPELLILDEPTSALDPISRLKVRTALLEARACGKSVFLSSHQLSELELICDRVVFLQKGRVLALGRTQDLLHNTAEFEIVAEGISSVPAMARQVSREGSGWRFTVSAAQQRAAAEQIWANGGALLKVVPKTRSLEELFVDLMTSTTSEDREKRRRDNC